MPLFPIVDLGPTLSAAEAARNAAEQLEGIAPWYPNRDESYWPCSSGEAQAPVLTSFTYSRWRDKPALLSSTAGATAVWPFVPRLSPISGRPILAVSFYISADPAAGAAFRIGVGDLTWNAAAQGIRLRDVAGTITVDFQTATPAGVETTAGAFNLTSALQLCELVLEDDAVELFVGNVSKARHIVRVWSSDVAGVTNRAPQINAVNESASSFYIAGVRAAWM